jgi:epoxyqueuosine reductase
MLADEIKRLALDCGFDLAGIAPAAPLAEHARYSEWVRAGMAGEMRYLTDHRGDKRADPRFVLPSARSVVCVGKLYNGPYPQSRDIDDDTRAWISRYAWGADYHDVLREGLARLAELLPPTDTKICVDTAPLLERSLARRAGLGWIGKNTCLIHEGAGSWFFLGELLTSLALEPDSPPPDRCGTCTRCIDACPTQAITPMGVDSRLCISYFTIELRGGVPEAARASVGRHVFGCDICQEVCPWNRGVEKRRDGLVPAPDATPVVSLRGWLERDGEELAAELDRLYVPRNDARWLRRNALVAAGNVGDTEVVPLVERHAQGDDPVLRDAAEWALGRLAERVA